MTLEEIKASLELCWEEIEKQAQKLKWALSLQSTSADQRLELVQRIEKLTIVLEKFSDRFYGLLQQHDETRAGADERERLWIHEHKSTIESFTKAVSDLRVSLATEKAAEEAADKAAKEAAALAEAAAAKVAESASTEIRKLREDVTSSQKTHKKEEEEEIEERSYPWYGRLAVAYLKAPPRVQLLSVIFGVVLLLAASMAVVLQDRFSRHDEEPPARAEREHRDRDEGRRQPRP